MGLFRPIWILNLCCIPCFSSSPQLKTDTQLIQNAFLLHCLPLHTCWLCRRGSSQPFPLARWLPNAQPSPARGNRVGGRRQSSQQPAPYQAHPNGNRDSAAPRVERALRSCIFHRAVAQHHNECARLWCIQVQYNICYRNDQSHHEGKNLMPFLIHSIRQYRFNNTLARGTARPRRQWHSQERKPDPVHSLPIQSPSQWLPKRHYLGANIHRRRPRSSTHGTNRFCNGCRRWDASGQSVRIGPRPRGRASRLVPFGPEEDPLRCAVPDDWGSSIRCMYSLIRSP